MHCFVKGHFMYCPIIVTCPRGLEEKLGEEIQSFLSRQIIIHQGYVSLKGDWKDIYAINLHSRLASRVLLQLVEGSANSEEALYQLSRGVPWDRWFSPLETIKVRVEGSAPWCRRFDILALKVKDAICDVFREKANLRPSVDKVNPDIRVLAHIKQKKANLYLDTSGEALFKRGWRQQSAVAPIRENLAAGLLSWLGYSGESPCLDPMCGCGTIAIEAAMIAAKIAPGLKRPFAFQKFRQFDSFLWNQLLNQAQKQQRVPCFPIMASDRSSLVIKTAIQNAQNAGVENFIHFKCLPFDQVIPSTSPGLLLSNPPYGKRLSDLATIQSSYPAWSTLLKQRFTDWTAAFFTHDLSFPKLLRLTPKRRIPLYNGKLECRLYVFDMVAGSNRRS
ncbi:MAG: THUMP domain-containing protein [Neisseriaceae bacterium]